MHEGETPAMATGDGAERNALTIVWRIENLSCFQKGFHGDDIGSPQFFPRTLEEEWTQLYLYPKGESVDDENVYLRCYTGSPFPVDYQFSLLSWEGIPLVTCKGIRYRDSIMGFYHEMTDCLTQKELFVTKKSTFLPHDTLTIQCRVWKSEGNFQNDEFFSACTRIEFAEDYTLRPIGGSNGINFSESDTFPVKLDFVHGRVRLDLNYSLTSDMQQKPQLSIEVTANRIPKDMLVKLEVSAIENGREVKTWREEFAFPISTGQQRWVVSKFVMSENLRKKLSRWGCWKDLGLRFHITAVCKVLSHCIERKCLGTSNAEEDSARPSTTLSEANCLTSEPSLVLPADLLRTLSEDFYSLYQKQEFSDFELRAGDVSFPVHRFVLSARSSVFSSMFSSEMKESNSKFLDIPDLDAHALNRMLTFMYGGTVEPDLPMESAAKMYYAADKYQVDMLKSLCSSIIQSQISVSNASDILILADRHQDSDLTEFVLNFILNHFDDVMDSNEWEKFMDINPALAGKSTLRLCKERKKLQKNNQ